MKSRLILLVSTVMFSVLFVSHFQSVTAGSANCSAQASGGIDMESSLDFTFECATDTQVFFGTCDSGGVPNDDLFNIVFGGQVTTYNYYVNLTDEYTVLGSATAPAGTNTATLNSLNSTPYPPATYSYAVSPNAGEVVDYLRAWCGADWKGVSGGVGSSCDTNLPVFTSDGAPSDGTLEIHVILGNESARTDEIVFQSWNVASGEQLNNKLVQNLPSPRFIRVWWQADGSSDWYLLPSQYWQGGGSTASDYGIACGPSPQPSYHTAFANAVPELTIYPSP